MASVFLRWAFPPAGLEVYGEFLREDFGRDVRHAFEEPDDLSGRMFGLQKTLELSGARIIAIRGEVVNSELHHSERMDRYGRPGSVPRPYPRYVHLGKVPQGHTQLGQILGSPAAYGGSGWTLGVDTYDQGGRWTIDLSRTEITDWLWSHFGTVGPGIADVIYALNLEAVRFARGMEWAARVTPSLNLNRNVEEGNDVFNLSVSFGVRGIPW